MDKKKDLFNPQNLQVSPYLFIS
jgi:hypothetical protein